MLIHPENLAILEHEKIDIVDIFVKKLTKMLSPIVAKAEISKMSIQPPLELIARFLEFLLCVQPDHTLFHILKSKAIFCFMIPTPFIEESEAQNGSGQSKSIKKNVQISKKFAEKNSKMTKNGLTSMEETVASKLISQREKANNMLQYQPFVQILAKLFSREQEHFNFSPQMVKALFSYLRLSKFMNFFIKKATGMITLKDEYGRKVSTVSQ